MAARRNSAAAALQVGPVSMESMSTHLPSSLLSLSLSFLPSHSLSNLCSSGHHHHAHTSSITWPGLGDSKPSREETDKVPDRISGPRVSQRALFSLPSQTPGLGKYSVPAAPPANLAILIGEHALPMDDSKDTGFRQKPQTNRSGETPGEF